VRLAENESDGPARLLSEQGLIAKISGPATDKVIGSLTSFRIAPSRRVSRFQNRIVRSDGGGIRNQSELHVIDPNPSLTFSLIGIASTK
jgi:hypothetical protein